MKNSVFVGVDTDPCANIYQKKFSALDTNIVNLHKKYLEIYLNFAIFVITRFNFNRSVC